MYDIRVEKVQRHYEMKIGCKWFFYATKEGMLAELANYLSNYNEVDKEYSNFNSRRNGTVINEGPSLEPEWVERCPDAPVAETRETP